jgi:hypothetical protein
MPSPFPGIDPYLEHPDRWSTVHNRLIVAIADVLTPQLLPKYQVDIEKRIYEIIGSNSLLVGRPDVSVQQNPLAQESSTSSSTTVLPTTQPIQVTVPMVEEVSEAYLEVKEAATQKVITAIEILSPTNKKGQGREKYERKRQQLLSSLTHLIEIDLLRDGEPLPVLEPPGLTDYRILVSRSQTRPIADLYAFNLPDPVPPFPIPLLPEDSEPVLNLKELLDKIYDNSGYSYFIDYSQEPIPALSTEEAIWSHRILQEKHLR